MATILEWLEEVKDPEVPVLSLVDLGVITDVAVEGSAVRVELTPTFVGCPALDMMKEQIREVLNGRGIEQVTVEVSFRKPWTTDMISEKGRMALKEFGLAPPPAATLFQELDILEHAKCPRCDGENTELRNAFGPTLCRSIHYCHTCREAFEQFKPL
ncbi:MAG TPA: 1,2-phenylacetyl-CoA epoxidase subunit PaaD [Chryseosolibacter sp.]|nr:1,2-phenylacetyl-CoA epoxidase subunit PaaD [Chryseosolibacter sp.]